MSAERGSSETPDPTGTMAVVEQPRSPEYSVRFHTLTRRPSNPWGLRGEGSVQVTGDELRLRRRDTGASNGELRAIPLSAIHDVVIEDEVVLRFGVTMPDGRSGLIRIVFDHPSDARRVLVDLPSRTTKAEIDERGRARAFRGVMHGNGGTPLTTLLILANIALYVVTGMRGARWADFSPTTLIELGSNFGPLTTHGEWWRLASATFLHAGAMHLIVNMITLNDIGRLCERLYGKWRYAVIYLASGLCGSIASLWWNPWVNSVGASGAVFGVMGAGFLYLADRRNGVPMSVMRAHLIVMGVFIVYALVSGFGRDHVDNAAHVGGLIAGLCIGWALAQPLGGTGKARPVAMAVGLGGLLLAGGMLLHATPRTYEAWETEKQFYADIEWFSRQEKSLLSATSSVIDRAQQRQVRQSEAAAELARIAAEWKRVQARLDGYRLDPVSKSRTLQEKLLAYVSARSRGAAALHLAVVAAPDASRRHLDEYNRLRKEADDYARQIHDWKKPPGV